MIRIVRSRWLVLGLAIAVASLAVGVLGARSSVNSYRPQAMRYLEAVKDRDLTSLQDAVCAVRAAEIVRLSSAQAAEFADNLPVILSFRLTRGLADEMYFEWMDAGGDWHDGHLAVRRDPGSAVRKICPDSLGGVLGS